MKGSDLELGQRIWEKNYSAGRVAALSESSESPHLVYALLKSDADEYTIYTFEKSCNCGPRVSRQIPGDAFLSLMSVLVDGVELPDEPAQPKKKDISPVVIKREEKATEVPKEDSVIDDYEEENEDEIFIGIDVVMKVV